MNAEEPFLVRSARWLTIGSVVSVLVSIAASQILLALAVTALLASGQRLRFPDVGLPLGLFLGGTLLSLAFSANPAAGLPQIRKFFVFLTLLAVYSTIREARTIRVMFLCWFAVGFLIALRGFVQFAAKVHEASASGRNFYEYYVAGRITGFMSHWMTFSGEEMVVFLVLAGFLLFAPGAAQRAWVWLTCLAVIGSALILGWTRNIWLATAVGLFYLVWCWRRWMVLGLPVIALLCFAISPERFESMLRPHKGTDSNEHRIVTWRTGLNMISQHPWLGLGPEGVRLQFDEYVPADIPRPLPAGWYGHLHNIYLHYAAERGVPVMLMLVWFLLKVVVDFRKGLRDPSRQDVRYILHCAIAVVIAIMVAGFFELNLGDSEVLALFLAVVAVGYVALDLSGVSQTPASAEAANLVQAP